MSAGLVIDVAMLLDINNCFIGYCVIVTDTIMMTKIMVKLGFNKPEFAQLYTTGNP